MTSASITFLVSHSAAGGVQEIWADLADGFVKHGFSVELLALYPHAELNPRPADLLPWTFVLDQKPQSIGGQLGLLRALVAHFRKKPPHIVFTAMPAANVIAPVAARMAGVSTQFILSHHTPVDTYNPTLNRLDGFIGLLPNVRTIIGVSKAVVASLDGKPKSYRAKGIVIPNALPPRIEESLAALAMQRQRTQAKGRSVVAIGRLSEQKNYPVLIRAAAHMPDVEIRIIGGGPLEADLRALAESLGVSQRVHFLGQLSRERALAMLADGDIFAQPSLFEGHSLALIEAAKLHLPLIVSDVSVQIEGITAPDGTLCGAAVPVADDAALAREILLLLDDPERYRKATLQARHLAESTTYDAMMKRYIALT